MRLVLATGNQGKVKELTELLAGLPVELFSLKEYPEMGEIIEDGDTFEENALIKARAVAKHTGFATMADDSGLEVDALDGQPGIYSARFAGEPKSDDANNLKLLKLLENVPETKRSARFRCVIAICLPDGREYTSHGVCEGVIGYEPSGAGGFGYDPLFLVPKFNKTFAQLDLERKNEISHRGRALQGAMKILKDMIL